MSELFLLTALVFSTLYLLFRQRIDLFLIAFLANILYGWQIIAGKIWVPPFEFHVTDNSRYILGMVFTGIFAFSLLNDLIFKHWFRPVADQGATLAQPIKSSSDNLQYKAAYMLAGISFSLALVIIFQANLDIVLLGKTDLNSKYPLTASFFLAAPAGVALTYGVYKRDIRLVFLSILPIFLYILIGFRSIAIVVIVAIIFLRSYQFRIISRRSLKLSILVLTIFFSFVVYKQAYIPIKEGKFEFFENNVEKDSRFDSTADFLLWAAFSAEFGQVSSNLELSSSRDLAMYHSYRGVFLGSIPLLDSEDVGVTGDPRFSDTIKKHANPGFSYGLGGTFWGENFVLGGILGVAIATIALGIFNIIAHYLIFTRGFVILLYLATNMVFLLPKMDLYAVIGVFKNIAVLVFIPLFMIALYNSLIAILSGRIRSKLSYV